jgi:hypothetical protein
MTALLLTILLVPEQVLCAGAERKPADYAQDTDVFRLHLQSQGLTFVRSFEELRADPSKALLIVLGDVGVLPRQFERFIRAGGAALVATDRATFHAGDALDNLGISVNGNYLWQDAGSAKAYRGLPYCPIVEPAENEALGVFRNLSPNGEPGAPLATNLPSFLHTSGLPRELAVVAYLPADSIQTSTAHPPAKGAPGLKHRSREPFAVGGALGRGRLLFLADHSIFINLMMQQTDNANLAFTAQGIAWLNESGQRNRVCFLDNGHVRDASDIHLQSLPDPPMPAPPSVDTLLGMVDPILAEVEEKDILNRALVNWIPRDRMLRWLLYLLTGGLICYGVSRLRKGRHRVDPNMPLLATAVARATPSNNPVEQRHRSLLASGNLWEPARMLTRQFFETMVGPQALNPKGQDAGRLRMPPFEVHRPGLRGWLLGQRVRRLWRFANVAAPQSVSIRQFRKLTGRIAALKDATRQGILRFSSPIQSVSRYRL